MTTITPAMLPEGWYLRHTQRTVAILEDGSTNVTLRGLELVNPFVTAGSRVAYIEWNAGTLEIIELGTHQDYRRRGLATMLYHEAQDRLGGNLQHSEWRTKDGQAWAETLGEPLPRWRLA